MNNKIAVHCPTEDEWNKVQKKAFSEGLGWWSDTGELDCSFQEYWKKENDCLALHKPNLQVASEEYWIGRGHTILSASDYLAYGLEGRAFEVGDEVEVVGEGRYFSVGDKGKVSFSDGSNDVCIKCHHTTAWVDADRLKLIESEDSMKDSFEKLNYDLAHNNREEETHTVPLRVDDRVRVVGLSDRGYERHPKGSIKQVTTDDYNDGTYGIEGYVYPSASLELIPTEADITVGSVWEALDGCNYVYKGEIRTVKEIDGTRIKNKENGLGLQFQRLLKDFKLIHRGDGEVVFGKHSHFDGVNDYQSVTITPQHLDAELIITTKTNKKEKKMKIKKAEQVLRVGMPMMDMNCGNFGIVQLIHEKTGKVVYEDQVTGDIETTDITKCYKQFVLPKPKPVKKKTKKTRRGK